ncbi:MAG: glycoside hydrolase family 16 [Bacteroidetes bacterium]|nr:glycoside hydrolase family 16 [Bacteroidota bacterium]
MLLLSGIYMPVSAQMCAGTKVILLDTLVNDGTEWHLEFSDEFDATALDLSVWEGKISSQGALDGSDAYRTLDNVTVSPETYYGESTSATGVCLINLKQETVVRPATFWDPGSPVLTYHYTSADVVSKQQFSWGKYEIRCKLPKGKGFTTSFWMYGEQNKIGNEIDVFEMNNEYNILGEYDEKLLCKVPEMHYHLWDKTASLAGIDNNCGTYTGNARTTDYSEDFHTFTLVWDRWALSWYIDGRLIKSAGQWYDLNGNIVTAANIKPMQVVLRNDWYPTNLMAIIFALNIESGKGAPDNSVSLPASMLIDYIRYYKKN